MKISGARLLWALVLVEVLATAADLLLGPWARISPEERLNVRAGLQIACGHLSSLWDLQYRPFCGGCTAEALIAAPLFRILPPLALTWKLVPAAFHLIGVTTGALLSLRAAGPSGAALFTALMIGAPTFYRDLATTGWGNHAESTAFPLLAALLLTAGLERRSRLLPALAGVVCGLGLWFCATAAAGVAAVLVLALSARRRGGLWLLVGLPVGLLPALIYRLQRPAEQHAVSDIWGHLQIAPPGALVRWLATDFWSGGLAPGLPQGEISALSVAWWGSLALLSLAGIAAAPRRFAPLALLALIAAFALRFDLWDDNPVIAAYDSFNLRYRAPLVPLTALLAALAASRWPRPALAIGLAAAALGLSQRVTAWSGPAGEWRAPAHGVNHEPDPTVPSGQPPQRLARMQGRPADISAAQTFIEGHADPLQDCRLLHIAELGRRVGIARGRGEPPHIDLQLTPEEQAAFALGGE